MDQPNSTSLVLPKEKLVRPIPVSKQKFNTVLIVGSGAIRDGWSPLPAALGCHQIEDPNILASIMAAYTFGYKRLRNELLITLHDDAQDPIKMIAKLSNELHALREHRHQVATAYQTAQIMNRIALKPCEPVDMLLEKQESLAVITTNWDSLIWHDPRFKHVTQLHGICSNPDSLIFPSELGTDDDIFELAIRLALKNGDQNMKVALNKLAGHYRGTDALLLKEAHDVASKWLQQADEIVVWGLALHPYDAEVLSILQNARGPERVRPLKKLTIINPSKSDRDRAGFFIGGSTTERVDLIPDDASVQ